MFVRVLFSLLGLSGLADAAGRNLCSTDDSDGWVKEITDGTYDRCFAAITPCDAPKPMPVLFYFHGAGGNGAHCGNDRDIDFGMSLADYAHKHGFALVCGEAAQGVWGNGGYWAIPEIQTDQSGTQCDAEVPIEGFSYSPDIIYMRNVIKELQQRDDIDVSRLYTAGCSMGSAFSEFIGFCLHEWATHPVSSEPWTHIGITGFATHSTGLKIKGDGNWLPNANNETHPWGECDGCQYFPMVPAYKPDLKACLNDNTADPRGRDPMFYRTTVQMAAKWKEAGNRVETFYNSGGHCQIHSFWDMVNCLDDGTGNLVHNKTSPHTEQK